MLAQVAMVLAVVVVVGIVVRALYCMCPFCRHYNLKRNSNQEHDGRCAWPSRYANSATYYMVYLCVTNNASRSSCPIK